LFANNLRHIFSTFSIQASMTDSNHERLHAIVEGHVQGVGFRSFVFETAYLFRLTGWVRNRWDETVEVIAEGERGTLEKLLATLRQGPRSAWVSRVNEEWLPATGEFTDFRLRPTE
jgi:acylphosphatase